LHRHLSERAGQLLDFPRGRRLASLKSHHNITDAHGLTGLERQIARQAVALVEQAEHRNTLCHRRCLANRLSRRLYGFSLGSGLRGLGGLCRSWLGAFRRKAVLERRGSLPRGNRSRRDAQSHQAEPLHAASGLHAS
jgi:hypothetical protein